MRLLFLFNTGESNRAPLPTAPLQLDAVVIALDRRAVHPAGVIQLRQSAFPLAARCRCRCPGTGGHRPPLR